MPPVGSCAARMPRQARRKTDNTPETGQNNGKFQNKGCAVKDLEKKQEKTRKGRLSRLVWANVIAALALLTVTVTVLHVLGLLGSIFAFFF